MTVGQWIAIAKKRLEQHGITSPSLEAHLIAAHVLRVDKSDIIAHPEHTIQRNEADALLTRRIQGEPLAYIVGTKYFYGREFIVNSSVLIPREETELLVEKVLPILKRNALVVDVGTGSGCIAVTLALESQAHVIASDVSRDALQVAQSNAKQHRAPVSFIRSDCLTAFQKNSLDVIVSNPPYVNKDDPALQQQVAKWEPPLALYANNGIDFIKCLIETAHQVLKTSGVLAIEFGYNQKNNVVKMVQNRFNYHIYHDHANIPRCVIAWKK